MKDLHTLAYGIYMDIITVWKNDETFTRSEIPSLISDTISDVAYENSDNEEDENSLEESLLELVMELIEEDKDLNPREIDENDTYDEYEN